MMRTLARSPLMALVFGLVTVSAAFGARGSEAGLPDLVALAPTDPEIIAVQGEPHLWITTGLANIGTHPLDLRAVVSETGALGFEQCVDWHAPLCAERAAPVEEGLSVGEGRIGCPDVRALLGYRITDLDEEGRPGDVTFAESVASHSVANGRAYADAPEPGPVIAPYHVCTPLLQGLSPGWGQFFAQDEWDQQIPIRGLPDGRYAVVNTVDPGVVLLETARSNNAAWTAIEIAQNGTRVDIIETEG